MKNEKDRNKKLEIAEVRGAGVAGAFSTQRLLTFALLPFFLFLIFPPAPPQFRLNAPRSTPPPRRPPQRTPWPLPSPEKVMSRSSGAGSAT